MTTESVRAAPGALTVWWLPICLSAVLAGLLVASLFAGAVSVPATTIAEALLGRNETVFDVIVWELRVPRTILAAFIGASLGLSGAVLQGLLRNPLASPGIVGVSASAALGAVIAFYSGIAAAFPLGLPMGGMVGAATAVALLMLLSGRNTSTLTLILAGVAVNSLAGALTWLVLNLSSNPYAATEIIFWMMGSLADRSFEHVGVAAALMVPGWILMGGVGRGLDALTLGEDAATSMGVNLARVRWFAVLGTALAVGAAVSVSGVIGFIGLVVPHLLCPLVGHQPSRLLPVSALGGAVLLVATDIAVRMLSPGPELKIGVVTALFGAPFFLVLLLRLRNTTQ